MRALLSVTNKSGIVEFATNLIGLGYEILSTGGTAKALRGAGLAVTDVAQVTNFPEMLDGRVKTLHPSIHGGLLGDRQNDAHVEQMDAANIKGIDLLAVNLYAFEETVTVPHSLAEAIEAIDIGGPAMIRAASKNYLNVTVVVDPEDYSEVTESLKNGGDLQALRLNLMSKAFRHTAYYDSRIAAYFSKQSGAELLPETLTVGYRKKLGMRYGENPHQNAALYTDSLATPGMAQAKQLWGKELSYNNILDGDAAWELTCDLPSNSCAIIKHGNPCGVASLETAGDGYRRARQADPISAFGGIAAFHGEVDEEAALAMTDKGNFLEVVIATHFTEGALEIFKNRSGWGQNVRLLEAKIPTSERELTLRTIRGGVLVQESDEEFGADWKVVTAREPSAPERSALEFVWKLVKHVKSNAIVIGESNALLGIGAGQMNRVQSVRLAIEQAGEAVKGAALASDAFFPFPDSIVTASEAGISAIIQPGGSVKDAEVIAEADNRRIAMIFTGVRHFRH